jgi:hypothetical protein
MDANPGAACTGSLLLYMATTTVVAQSCDLRSTPTASTTNTEDGQRMSQLGKTFPALPVRQGTAWPWNDLPSSTNAWPTALSNAQGNWTEAQPEVIIRTAWGKRYTYVADPRHEPKLYVQYPNISADKKGGALSGYGHYGPFSNSPYCNMDLLSWKNGRTARISEDRWAKRPAEIFNFLEPELYGPPIEPSIPVSWMVTSTAGGRQVGSGGLTHAYEEKTFTGAVDRSSYSALSTVPVLKAVCRYLAGGGRHPVVVTYGEGTPSFQYTTLSGIGSCSYDPTAYQSDRGGANFSSYLIALINKANWWKPSDSGTLEAWGWGVSRLIDGFQNHPDFDSDKMADGRTFPLREAMLIAAAYDERLVVASPHDAGAMGTATDAQDFWRVAGVRGQHV